jgi:hypothetical protein
VAMFGEAYQDLHNEPRSDPDKISELLASGSRLTRASALLRKPDNKIEFDALNPSGIKVREKRVRFEMHTPIDNKPVFTAHLEDEGSIKTKGKEVANREPSPGIDHQNKGKSGRVDSTKRDTAKISTEGSKITSQETRIAKYSSSSKEKRHSSPNDQGEKRVHSLRSRSAGSTSPSHDDPESGNEASRSLRSRSRSRGRLQPRQPSEKEYGGRVSQIIKNIRK